MQDLWHVYYQVLSKIFLKEFIELSVNMDMMIKNVKKSVAIIFLNVKTDVKKDDLIEYKCFLLQQKLSTQVWWKIRQTIF